MKLQMNLQHQPSTKEIASSQNPEGNMKIKVLGPGCPKCDRAFDIVMEVLEETGTEVGVEKITDILKYS